MNQEIPKVYNPADVEQKWYKIWEESGVFKPEENSSKEPFTIVIPPPNVTGSLHMGHALDNGIQDCLIRYKKMQGFNTLWVPGTDHAGIATQNVVEKALRKEGTSKDKLGREEFLKRVWQWKEEYGGRITKQLRRLGCALDWSRERFTMDEGLSKAVTKEFVTLYNEGLIYKGKRLINWCPRCGTAISDIEVEYEAKKGKLWYIKYGPLVVATTRPETMLGDSAVAVNPKDERYKHLIGTLLDLPLTDRKIPVIADDFVDPDFGTGAVKVTPAHDPNDFEIGERHDLPRIIIMTPDAKITVGEFNGLDRFEARKKIVAKLEELGLIDKIEDYENSVGECYRCKTVIEPYLSDQWYVKVADLAREAIKVVEEGKISYVPDRWTKVYINWMTNLKDWCISRQLWWGHRIPAWYCRGKMTNDQCPMPNECNEIIVSEETPKKCPKCGGTNLTQDPDVFDTWFSSALWPFSTLGWPDQTKDLKTFYPTSVLVTGYDIITFWVSRMIMMATHFMKKAPFHTVFIHGLVRDASGKKMSKSTGNVIDPLELIDKVGADALRFALISLITGQGQDIKVTPDKITEARNFANKLWNVSRFVLAPPSVPPLAGHLPLAKGENEMGLADKWIISRYNSLIADTTKYLDNFEFGDAARAIYDFLWGDFCDWYVEISKNDLYSDDAKKKERVQGVLLYVLEGSLRLLHPFMPFITEEINDKLKMSNDKCRYLLLEKWPEADQELIDPQIEKQMELIKEVIVKVRNIKAEMGVQTKDIELIFVAKNKGELETLKSAEAFIKSLAKAVKIEFKSAMNDMPEQAASGVVADIQFFIPLKGLIDLEKEVERLKKEEENLIQEIKRLEGLLANKNFTSKAPPETIDKQKEALSSAQEKLAIVKERIKDLA